MIKILVTGANSYIGKSFINYMAQWSSVYCVDAIHTTDGSWRESTFIGYDVIIHVAAIAHIKETKESAHFYYEINRDLAVEVAEKAKRDGVSQFIFLSSMSVYGMNTGVITRDTFPTPKTHYGKSKLEAENLIKQLQSDIFNVAILRALMVYGKGCRGNFQSVVKILEKSPIFPSLQNSRSMIYVFNLCEYIKILIDQHKFGIFFPQNKEYMTTSQMARWIVNKTGNKVHFSRILGFFILMMRPLSGKLQKAFGSLIYNEIEDLGYSHCKIDNEKSIKESVG
ncbi:MAG: NAD-dependent epimerase/dehydratase family protein [Oscillospiraceae bacterium]